MFALQLITKALHVRSGDRYKNHAAAPLADVARRIAAAEDQQGGGGSGSGADRIQAVFMATDDPQNLDEADAFVRE